MGVGEKVAGLEEQADSGESHWGPHCYYSKQPKYWIGSIQGRVNGWCHREHIFGVLVEVAVTAKGLYFSRPLPKEVFAEVYAMVKDDRWNSAAAKLCEPLRGVRAADSLWAGTAS